MTAAGRPDSRVPKAFCGGVSPAAVPATAPEPLRWCVLTTVALLTWIAGPAVVATMAGFGVVAYRRHGARRGRARCLLRDVRLVMAYLGAVFLLSAAATLSGLLPG